MAFQSLYRKHRPQTFGELVGQEAVSTALRAAASHDSGLTPITSVTR